MSYTEPPDIKELRREAKDVRAVMGSLYRASVDGETMTPQKQEQPMLTIKSRQIRNQVYTIAEQHVSFDVHGVGHIPACYRVQVERFISRNQGFFTIVEEEKPAEVIVEKVAPVVIPVEEVTEIHLPEELPLEEEEGEEDFELSEDMKQFLAAVEQPVVKEKKTKVPATPAPRGRPPKKK